MKKFGKRLTDAAADQFEAAMAIEEGDAILLGTNDKEKRVCIAINGGIYDVSPTMARHIANRLVELAEEMEALP